MQESMEESRERADSEERTSRASIAAGVTSAGVVAAAALAVAVNQAGTSSAASSIPEGSILVNGKVHQVESPADTPLLYVLRDELGLHGPKFGCGLAQCGACSVLVGSRETRSCVTGWTTVRDEVTTLEGLPALWARRKRPASTGSSEALHPVQQAWIDQQVPQCGYCQSGMMIMAVDLLTRVPNPSRQEIVDAFTKTPPSPHLCRCGTYMSIIAAVQRAARLMA
jgi:isoquinoline 1-oxidoreductase subunit alpha